MRTLSLSLRLCRKLQFQPLSAEVPVLFQVVELPQNSHLCKVKSLNKGDANSEVTVYYQVKNPLLTLISDSWNRGRGDDDVKLFCLSDLCLSQG